jgi:hypothetical protein
MILLRLTLLTLALPVYRLTGWAFRSFESTAQRATRKYSTLLREQNPLERHVLSPVLRDHIERKYSKHYNFRST